MEIALFAAAVAWAYREWIAADGAPTAPDRASRYVGARDRSPRGNVARVWRHSAGWGLAAVCVGRVRWRHAGRGLVVVAAAALVPPLVNLIATGEARSAGFLAKSMLAWPRGELVGRAPGGASASGESRGGVVRWVRPAGRTVSVCTHTGRRRPRCSCLPARRSSSSWGFCRRRCRRCGNVAGGRPCSASCGWGRFSSSTCTLEEPDAHFCRYQMPILPVFLDLDGGWSRANRVGR